MTQTDTKIFTAALILIGDELLSGRTQDANMAALAQWLNGQGIRLRHARVVPDVEGEIVAAVNACRGAYDYVFTTGGIGPTHDDITVDAIAAALSVPVILHPIAEQLLRAHYGPDISDTQLRMARTPEGASLIENAVSGAPGIKIDNIFILAGVPAVMRAMLTALTGTLQGGLPLLSAAVGAYMPESRAANLLTAIETRFPGVQVGSYPFWRNQKVGANFVLRCTSRTTLDAATQALKTALEEQGESPVLGEITAG